MKLAAVIVLVAPHLALADNPREITLEPICAVTDPGDDLDADGRTAAGALLARTLERENQLVVEAGCTQTFRVGHQLDGDLWTVRITGPNGTRRWTRATTEKLPQIYRDLVQAVLELPAPRVPSVPPVPAVPAAEVAPAGPPVPELETAPVPLARRDVENSTTSPPPAPFPVAQPDFGNGGAHEPTGFYGTFGFGGGGGIGAGTTLSFGIRRSRGTLAFDGSLSVLDSETGSTFRVSAEALRLSKPRRDRSSEEGVGFAGGGLSFSGTDLTNGSNGAGLAGELTAGYLFDSDGSSLFVQADISLPFYRAGDAYPATFTIAVGYGAL